MVRHSVAFSLVSVVFCISSAVSADTVPIDPFDGVLTENFDSFREGGGLQELVIFDGFATIRNLTPGGAIKVEYMSSLDRRLVVPHSRPLMMGQWASSNGNSKSR